MLLLVETVLEKDLNNVMTELLLLETGAPPLVKLKLDGIVIHLSVQINVFLFAGME